MSMLFIGEQLNISLLSFFCQSYKINYKITGNMYRLFRREDQREELPCKSTTTPHSIIPTQQLEYIASSNLCELSSNICKQENSKGTATISQYNYYSPWELGEQKLNLDRQYWHPKRKQVFKMEKLPKQSKNKIQLASEDKQNQLHSKLTKLAKQEYQIQKYPSIFMRIKAAKQLKPQISYKQRQTEILTIMRRRRSNNVEFSQVKKIALSEQVQNFSNNLKLYHKKIEDLQMIKKKSFNSITQVPSSVIEISQLQHPSKGKGVKSSIDHWNTRRLNAKPKKQIRLLPPRQSKSIERKQSKQNVSVSSKKTSISLEKIYKQQYQSSNPLTRLLYEKYINTIHVNHFSREEKFHL